MKFMEEKLIGNCNKSTTNLVSMRNSRASECVEVKRYFKDRVNDDLNKCTQGATIADGLDRDGRINLVEAAKKNFSRRRILKISITFSDKVYRKKKKNIWKKVYLNLIIIYTELLLANYHWMKDDVKHIITSRLKNI